jgi:hypothetical protein
MLPGSKGYLKYLVHRDHADDGARDFNFRVFHDMFYIYIAYRETASHWICG